ncbi:hypothetical protein LCGC14_2730070 [marine sediment metagenome]|uniref:Uncharacterized protein n=1 Tax=marine sediment metagenome TaxID=412755 RepID=A0A0F8ZUX1_9ZZZZ
MLDIFSSPASLVATLPELVGLGFVIGILSGWPREATRQRKSSTSSGIRGSPQSGVNDR